MKRFTRVLSEAHDQLKIPEPSRTRVLLEMASDLEDSYQFHLSQGCDETEAAQRAEEAFGTSEEALKHLTRIHESGLGGMQNRLSGQIGRAWEKVLLLAIVAFEIFAKTGALGNPFIFLMAGVATDYTEIGLLWSNIGKRTALWLPAVTVPQILLVAYLFNQL